MCYDAEKCTSLNLIKLIAFTLTLHTETRAGSGKDTVDFHSTSVSHIVRSNGSFEVLTTEALTIKYPSSCVKKQKPVMSCNVITCPCKYTCKYTC